MGRIIARNTGLPEAEAQARVDKLLADAKVAADTARKATAFAASWTAIVTLLAAVLGLVHGNHRRRSSRSKPNRVNEARVMTLSGLLVLIIVLALIGALPNWGYSRDWGYGPSGVLGTVLVLLLLLALLGRLGPI